MTRGDRRRRARTTAALAAAAVLGLGACGDQSARTEGTDASSPAATPADVVAEGLDAPWSIVFFGGAPLISERDSGRVLELRADGTPREVAVVDGVVSGGEGGLLGLAVRDRWLYAYFTAADDNRIVRFPITGDPGTLRLGAPQPLLEGIPKSSNHNGGRLAFGPDGQLYATTGDAGDPDRARDRDDLGGKILRVAPDGRVPADNPFPRSPVYSLGHRNPQGLAWGDDGRMYATEFGQDTWDELNVIERGGDYGWPEVEGIAHRAGFIDPVQQWAPSDASPSGIAFADGAVHIANLRGERLRRVAAADPAAATESLGGHGRLRDVTRAPDGSLWVLTNNTDGRGDPDDGDDRILRVAATR